MRRNARCASEMWHVAAVWQYVLARVFEGNFAMQQHKSKEVVDSRGHEK